MIKQEDRRKIIEDIENKIQNKCIICGKKTLESEVVCWSCGQVAYRLGINELLKIKENKQK